ncbi:MAG: pirin family protein [Clostridiales bacterium]|nr:pirin family protein [Clostridiales bacterium]
MSRFVKSIIIGQNTIDGAGVKLKRILNNKTAIEFDPFLMLDVFDSKDPYEYIKGFPWHPHRGIETITYLITGELEHGDSLGNKGKIFSGSCQWMTAGSGILHWEMPQSSEHFMGIQLWLNLPRKDKYAEPKYFDIKSDSIPELKTISSSVKIISGSYKGISGPAFGDYVKLVFLDISLGPETTWDFDLDSDDTCFLYIIDGDICLGKNVLSRYERGRVLLFSQGPNLEVSSSKSGARFLLFSAKPTNEPIAWGGPIVMNSKEELNAAFEELDLGTFIKHQK